MDNFTTLEPRSFLGVSVCFDLHVQGCGALNQGGFTSQIHVGYGRPQTFRSGFGHVPVPPQIPTYYTNTAITTILFYELLGAMLA